jgi:hypothetical protein
MIDERWQVLVGDSSDAKHLIRLAEVVSGQTVKTGILEPLEVEEQLGSFTQLRSYSQLHTTGPGAPTELTVKSIIRRSLKIE